MQSFKRKVIDGFIGPSAVVRKVLRIRVCSSILPSFCPKVFFQLAHQFFLKLPIVLESYVMLCVIEPDFFFFLIFCPTNTGNGPKIGFFGFIGKFSLQFFLNLVYKEKSYYLLYSWTNPMLRKNMVPETWPKMLLVNQITGFLC